jgi:hypothetical protein
MYDTIMRMSPPHVKLRKISKNQTPFEVLGHFIF